MICLQLHPSSTTFSTCVICLVFTMVFAWRHPTDSQTQSSLCACGVMRWWGSCSIVSSQKMIRTLFRYEHFSHIKLQLETERFLSMNFTWIQFKKMSFSSSNRSELWGAPQWSVIFPRDHGFNAFGCKLLKNLCYLLKTCLFILGYNKSIIHCKYFIQNRSESSVHREFI